MEKELWRRGREKITKRILLTRLVIKEGDNEIE
jgi:ribosomal protein L31E